jgi:hypothetical protein
MKFQDLAEGNDPAPEQSVVDRFAGVAASQRSYYIMKWAEKKGMDTDDAMHKAGYVRDGYMGAGAWNWRYVGMDESVEEEKNPDGPQDDESKDDDYSMPRSKREKEQAKNSATNEFTPDKVYNAMMKRKRVGEADDEVDTGPTWKDDLEDALDGYPEWAHEYIKDGVCPECGGNGYMDGDYENEDGEENEECNGMYNYDCDEGEIRDNTWADELKSKEPEAPKQPAPSKEEIMKILPRLHDDYVKSGRYNAFELGGILKQMYPELNKREAGSYVADFLSNFKESADLRKLAGLEENTKDEQLPNCELCKGKGCDACGNTGADDGYIHRDLDEGDSDDVVVAKMLSKALGDPNRWMEMSPPELYAELESTNPEVADVISKVAKMLYDVRLEERAYKDVGVADTVKDQRGKEFNFDKGSKKFKSQDGEEADVTTKLGKDLMRIRKNQMKKTTPSYKTKKNQGIMASIEEAYGDNHEITLEDNEDFNDVFGVLGYSLCEQDTFEAEYQGRKVKLNKPMQGDTKKFKVYVKDPKTGNVKKVNFGHGGSSVKGKAMKIRKSNPKARKSFRARHNCDNPGPKTKARYWSCRKW